jgi:hypothetical protein
MASESKIRKRQAFQRLTAMEGRSGACRIRSRLLAEPVITVALVVRSRWQIHIGETKTADFMEESAFPT